MNDTTVKPTELRCRLLADIANGRIIHARHGRRGYEQIYEGVANRLSGTAEAGIRDLRRLGLIHQQGKLPGQPVELTTDGKMTWARWAA